MTNKFDKEFVMNIMFDDDNVCNMNRLIVAVTNVIKENCGNLTRFNDLINEEFKQSSSVNIDRHSGNKPSARGSKGFFETNVCNFSEEHYIAEFKMNKSTIQALINFLKKYVNPGNISLDKKVHIFLWVLVSDCSFNDCGKLFGLNKSTVSYIFHEIATYLYEQRHHFVNWPSLEEQHITRVKVNSRFKFPNCVGFVDACRFQLGTKRNKMDKPGIVLLQAVCDETLMFIDFYVGEIGRSKKSKVFKESKLTHKLKDYIAFENHLLGDSEYRLQNNLITPFTSEELLTSEDMKFNEIHWKTRSYIGHALELLKERFRKLNHIDIVKPESVFLLISSACILHNFILIHEGCSSVKEEVVMCDDGVTINTNIVQTAEEKRQFLCNYINFIDSEEPDK